MAAILKEPFRGAAFATQSFDELGDNVACVTLGLITQIRTMHAHQEELHTAYKYRVKSKKINMVSRRLVLLKDNKEILYKVMAHKIGVSEGVISGWVYLSRPIPLGILHRICQVFDVSIKWMLKGAGTIEDKYDPMS